MPIFSTNQPGIRARLLPRFPAQVLAGTGIAITKSGGTYIFSTAISGMPLSSLSPILGGTVVGRSGEDGLGPPTVLSVTGGLLATDGFLQMSPNQKSRALNAVFFTTGPSLIQDFSISVSCTVKRVVLLADAAGNAQVDIWKINFAGYPPSGANTIIGASGTPVKLVGTLKYQDNVLAGWVTTTIVAGDIVRIVLGAVAAPITRVTVTVDVEVT
jgi:hypothetical protein